MTDNPIHLETRAHEGVKIFSPTANRNKSPIFEALNPYLPNGVKVLEIASGTGEHAHYVCTQRPDIVWQPTDPDAQSRESQNAWRAGIEAQMLSSHDLDVMRTGWAQAYLSYSALYCANMIHIAPLEALIGLIAGAKEILSKGQILALYGPFLEGDKTAASNLEFDKTLSSKNPDWGVRDLTVVKHMFADAGFNVKTRIEMPRENRLLIFENVS